MLNFFKRKAAGATERVVKFEKLPLMEGVVAIAVLLMYADGEAEASEQEKIGKILANKPALAAFGAQVTQTFNAFDNLCRESGMIIARVELMRKIEAVKGEKQEMEDVFLTGVTVALADGEIEEAEKVMLNRIGQVLGLRLDDYL